MAHSPAAPLRDAHSTRLTPAIARAIRAHLRHPADSATNEFVQQPGNAGNNRDIGDIEDVPGISKGVKQIEVGHTA